MKKETPENLPSLSDQDIVTVARSKFSSIVRSGKNVTVSLALATTGTMLTGCADEKSCTDGDVTQWTATDYGTFQDPSDPYVISTSDPSGSGDRCADYD
ncbi:MAG: hypothetical protein ABI599_02155 [Flavobacteriales bacterium]